MLVNVRAALTASFLGFLCPWCFSQSQLPPSKTVPLSTFQLPEEVRLEFENRGCSVAQSGLSRERHNVLHGEFAAPGQFDWMIACWNGTELRPEVFWGGPRRCELPMSPDMRMIMTAGAVSIAITPELQIAPPRQGEDHARVTERWSVTGVWSYYCANNEWQMTEGDSCSKASRTENVKRGWGARKIENQQSRSKPEDFALAEVKSVLATMRPVIPTNFGRAVVRCTFANSTRQLCIVKLVDGINFAATVDLERLQTGAWFATNAQVTRCRPE